MDKLLIKKKNWIYTANLPLFSVNCMQPERFKTTGFDDTANNVGIYFIVMLLLLLLQLLKFFFLLLKCMFLLLLVDFCFIIIKIY